MNNDDDVHGVRVWLGRVPPGLCVGEEPVRELFRSVGELLSVQVTRHHHYRLLSLAVVSTDAVVHEQIHHDFADMSAEGFMFVTFATVEAAEAAVRAVVSGALDPENRFNGVMQARLALRRGGPPTLERDEDTADLLLGRRLGNTLSQPGAGDDGDDDDLRLLQSLSQSAFSQQSSQVAAGGGTKPTKGRTKGRTRATTTKQPKLEGGKRRRKARANSFLSPALDV